METLCLSGRYCTGGAAPATPCLTPANCAVAGLSAEPPCVWSVTTLAGSGSQSPIANGQGASATFNYPSGVAVDASGVVYVADYSNNLIRAVTRSGLVSTLATGFPAGPLFLKPRGVATYPGSGIIYVADYYHISKLTPSGVVTAFAGPGAGGSGTWADGQGTSARFLTPFGLTVDSAGVVYVADTGNNRIRKITPLGAVTTLAGTGSSTPFSNGAGISTATFNSPQGVAVDGSGNVYVGDALNHRIRLILPNGTVSTFAGRNLGFGSWADGAGTSAEFSGPNQLTFAANGNLLVPDGSNNRIRMITPLGVVTTIAGGSTNSFLDGYGSDSLFSNPSGATVNSAGTLYIGDRENNRIRQLTCPICPAFFYCPSPVSSPILCPSGTICPAGSFAPQTCPPGKFATQGALTCQNCPRGSFEAASGSSLCSGLCPGGTYGNASGSTAAATGCRQCPAGTFNEDEGVGSIAGCILCSPGSFSRLSGALSATACASCPVGSASATAGSTGCTPCSVGFYADTPGSSQCTPCPSGTYSNTPSSPTLSSCSPCAAGTYGPSSGQTSAGCIPCPPGTASSTPGATSLSQCALCSAGTFSSLSGSLSCTTAPAGSFSTGPGATQPMQCSLGKYSGAGVSSCAACPLGSAASTSGSAVCTNCSAGHYADALGLSFCTPCPIGTFNNLPSSSSPSACQPCPSGTFNPSLGQTSSGCISCPPGTASSTPGASSLSQCTPCSAGTYASLAGSSSCMVSPAGSFSAPPLSGGGTGATSPTQCPLGTYNGISGAVSVSQCTACPSGKTTASTGATQGTQCLALPFACPAGKQPTSASAASLADCAPLTCPLPLRPSAFAGFGSDSLALATSLSCLGCASGTLGTVPACTPCDGTAFCPGITSRPLFNFSGGASASGAPRALMQGSGTPTSPFSACPVLASFTRSVATTTLASAATSTAFFGAPLPTTSSQSLLAWFVIFSLLFTLAMFVACSRTAENATGCSALPLRALKAVDLFSMNHKVEDKTSPINEATPLGGLFSLMGLTTLLTYAAYMVATWVQDNTLVQKSLATMGPSVWGELAALPWVAPSASSLLGSLALRLTIDGNPGACAAPLSMTTTSLDSGSFVLKSTADCGGSGISQHTLTCPGCRLTSDTSVSLLFDYSCQSMLLEALGSSPSYPGPLALSTISAPTARTASPKPGVLLTSLTWQLTPVLSVLWDNVTSANSAIGWYLADSKLTLAPFLTPPALNGSLSIIPSASPVTVTFALSLSSTYSSTLLTQRVPITQLLANIVGLSGLLAFFGMAFGSFEGYCARKKGGMGAPKHLPLSSSTGSAGGDGGGSALGGSLREAGSLLAVDSPLRVGYPALLQCEAGHAEGSLAGELQALRRKVEALEAAVGPLEDPRRAAAAVVVWQRHSDASGDEWYTSSAGETAWELPLGAFLQPAA